MLASTVSFLRRASSRFLDPITVLLPCHTQKEEFFRDAVLSVREQTSQQWRLLLIVERNSPPHVLALARAQENGIDTAVVFGNKRGLGGALNVGMQIAKTQFVCVLLSDDRLAPEAVATLQRYRARRPEVDFFHSSRRLLNARGEFRGPIYKSVSSFSENYFWNRGSPVKHLLCWRRELALQYGGMDETLSAHGCDDFDFPWTMLERGMCFASVKECLYHYRVHHEHSRLTTHVPVEEQVAVLRKIFRKHGVGQSESEAYIRRALAGYLHVDRELSFD